MLRRSLFSSHLTEHCITLELTNWSILEAVDCYVPGSTHTKVSFIFFPCILSFSFLSLFFLALQVKKKGDNGIGNFLKWKSGTEKQRPYQTQLLY